MRTRTPMHLLGLTLVSCIFGLSGCSREAEGSSAMPAHHAFTVELARTSHGVVHVVAMNSARSVTA